MTLLEELAKMIDHSILHPTMTDDDLMRECEVAKKYNVASVCVKPYAVTQAAEILKGSDVLVGCVIGFPHGNSSTGVKVFEAQMACKEGAVEIDMVINIGKALGGDWEYVEDEIKTIADVCHSNNAIVKVIFETDYITRDEDKIRLCEICTRAGADFVKTSTGYGFVKLPGGGYNYKGATIPDVELMRKYSGPQVKVKCAGGVRTLDDLLSMREAGATRSGATATESILEEAAKRFGK
ncbi:MAG TPA: deoxyribose-phosphate aldolase [Bacteroidales bacterium]|nr:deoxyribose-phosphate aldolase [Bacteroidales bacterium]